jgi:probable F420-dependent oxidoreductase
MRYGITMFTTDQSMDVVALARATEERGFDSLYLPEHTHIPVSRITPPATGEDELPEEYKRSLDPFIALAAAAAVTTTLELGTGIALPAQREPIVTAKAIATLDHISGGRVVLGVGFGWNEDEIEDHGVPFAARRAVAREHLMAMEALWADDVAGFEGEHVTIAPSWSWPKPVRTTPDRVRPPVLLGGGSGKVLFAHIAEYGDGWIPIGGAGLAEAIPRLRDTVADAGRDPSTLRIVPFGSIPDAAKLEHFTSIGVTECVFRIPSATADEVLPVLDRWAALVADLR